MNEKLKRITLKLEDTIEYYDTPQHVYDELIELSVKQPDYFKMIGAENIIKLTFLIYSHKRTSSFDLGEQMLNDSMFLFMLSSDGENHRTVCEDCGGEGQVDCHECDGVGEVPCSECDESGEINCDTCNGSGIDPENEEESCWDCNGDGVKTCPSCHGNTVEDCPECYGSRIEPCPECDEVGEIETDDLDYEMEIIATWDKNLIQESIEFENTLVPIMTLEEYRKKTDLISIKYYNNGYTEFRKGFKPDEFYCFGHDDDPKLKISQWGMTIVNVPFQNLKNFAV